jgi:anti-sigma B factor antagonist
MEIKIDSNGTEKNVKIEGRLDTTTAPQLEKELADQFEGTEKLVLDFENLQYISSAGLRVLLSTQKKINAQGASMVIRNANDMIMDVLDVTGFLDILTVESNADSDGEKLSDDALDDVAGGLQIFSKDVNSGAKIQSVVDPTSPFSPK